MIANVPEDAANPFQLYMLPLTYEHSNLLHAVLGFSASHIARSDLPQQATLAIEHKLLALQALSSLLIKEQCLGLTPVEEDIALSAVLLLLLQDVGHSKRFAVWSNAEPSRFANLECLRTGHISMV